MKTLTTTVYDFNELSDDAKERARQWYRECSAGDNDFADCVIDDAVTIAELLGIDLATSAVRLHGGGTRQKPNIYWSGFWSQGDGACFEGSWSASDVKPGKVRTHAPQDNELARIAGIFESIAKEFPNAGFKVRHTGRYYHAHSTSFDVSICDDDGYELETPEAGSASESLIETARDFMHWIYRQLEKEYDYQNSNEQVDDTIIANGYTFDESGNREG